MAALFARPPMGSDVRVGLRVRSGAAGGRLQPFHEGAEELLVRLTGERLAGGGVERREPDEDLLRPIVERLQRLAEAAVQPGDEE